MRWLLVVFVMLPMVVNAQESPARVIRSLAYSPDGDALAVAAVVGDKGEVTLLDARTQAVKWRHAQPQPCRGIVWVDGKRLAASVGQSLVLLDATTGRTSKTMGKHDKLINSLAVTPDGKTLATASNEDRTIKLWDVARGEERKTLPQATAIYRVTFSPDGKHLLVATEGQGNIDGRAKMLDAKSGNQVQVFSHGYYCPFAAFSPDGKEVLTVGWDGCARVWDVKTGNSRHTLSGNSGLNGASLNSKTHTLALWSDKAIRLIPFDRRPPDAVASKRIDGLFTQLDDDDFATREKAEAELRKIGFVVEPRLRVAREAKSAEVRIRSRRIQRALRTEAGVTIELPATIRAVMLSPDGKTLACGGEDGLVRFYDAATGKAAE